MQRRIISIFRQVFRFTSDITSQRQKILQIRAESNDPQAQFELALYLDSHSEKLTDQTTEYPQGDAKTTLNDIKVIQTKAKRKKMLKGKIDFITTGIQEQVEYWLRRACENNHLDVSFFSYFFIII